ncbi:grasp-with-spasm system ATP-grasp peptide maturase [Tenacibaculum singaporense]|uniref:Grasp-with-spasm system ATP-grasp peptide maturase n=1 Tax=Tenacibaculum singaporense TaxID=2358479 RepID=A0A3S8R3C4_9FLAO|nr:grasp-with-spasm system ATP-grasp peptide maturase [Tenacibaculum singaporense]AZJ34396.1 grasp-with-spasm system ATP-grasp peptide maturase [Tenacibaculum singaporense]
MILIVSELLDRSTNTVLDWCFNSLNIIRANKNDLKIVSIDYQKEEIIFQFREEFISSKNITSFWYRRGYLANDYSINNNNKDLEYLIYSHLDSEWNEIIRFFTQIFVNNKVKSLGSYQVKDQKLAQLKHAQKVGLRIPKTFITSSKEDLLLRKKNCDNNLITKGISASPSFTFDNISLEGYTELVSSEFIQSLPDTFFPSLFQESIEKLYELRIFYLKEKFYSMAIFSQNNLQTKIDVRKYDDSKPNRTVPYQLPKSIEEKLNKFMVNMGLDTGSIDMLVDRNNDFYFLEVNPNGQFGMVSTPCNYYIEREIAKELI